jgi:hypothetical protein
MPVPISRGLAGRTLRVRRDIGGWRSFAIRLGSGSKQRGGGAIRDRRSNGVVEELAGEVESALAAESFPALDWVWV